MQEKTERRSNRERTDETKARLIEAARVLFVGKAYAETGTPEIVAAAGVTRGALYHHFSDKGALFHAVVEQEAAAVAEEVEEASAGKADALGALFEGGRAYISAMQQPGRIRLLLLDGPAILGREEMDRIDAGHGGRTLCEGLSEAMEENVIAQLPLDALSSILSAAFDRAALSIAGGADADRQLTVLEALIGGLRSNSTQSQTHGN